MLGWMFFDFELARKLEFALRFLTPAGSGIGAAQFIVEIRFSGFQFDSRFQVLDGGGDRSPLEQCLAQTVVGLA